MDETITNLNQMMHGTNFIANFGYDVLDGCKTLPEAEAAIKKLHPESGPNEYAKLVKLNEEDFWEDVDYALNWRQEEHGEGPELKTQEDAARLDALVKAYRAYVSNFINEDSEIYSLPIKDIEGMGDIFWYYYYVIINKDGNTLFIYSGASD